MTSDGVITGADGIPRCFWAGSAPEYLAYHDDEWGLAVHGETPLYERITLEAFQSGLSWLTILRRRDGFRGAFAGFAPDVVAAFGEPERAALRADPRIVRNARKIDAAIANARAVVALREHGGLDALVWQHAPTEHRRPRARADVPSTSPHAVALASAQKSRGFTFVGPTTMYAAMQACGLVDDHLAGCHRAVAATGDPNPLS
ncbi:MAG: DNA-3-methyladenine glycosylase I [Dermatophilaceae bacterium]